jgi:hypothetical protein
VQGDLREKVPSEGKALAILLYGRGKASYGFIAKMLKVTPVAVMKWMKREATRLPDPDISSSIQEVSFDEMWHFLNKKKEKFGSGGRWTGFEIKPLDGLSGLVLLRHSESFSKDLST